MVDQNVVEDSSLLVGDQAVTDLTGREIRDAASHESIEQRGGRRTGEMKPAHVRHIKQGGLASGRMVFGHDRGVLHRHIPTGKIDHPASVRGVPRM